MYPRLFPWVRFGWLLALLRGRIPYPVLVLNGKRREFGEITVRVIREGTGCLARTRTTPRIITNRVFLPKPPIGYIPGVRHSPSN